MSTATKPKPFALPATTDDWERDLDAHLDALGRKREEIAAKQAEIAELTKDLKELQDQETLIDEAGQGIALKNRNKVDGSDVRLDHGIARIRPLTGYAWPKKGKKTDEASILQVLQGKVEKQAWTIAKKAIDAVNKLDLRFIKVKVDVKPNMKAISDSPKTAEAVGGKPKKGYSASLTPHTESENDQPQTRK